MAVTALILELACRSAETQGGGRACSAGYPDLLVSPQQLHTLLGPERAGRIPVRPDSMEILAWHGMDKVMDRVFDARAVFDELGYVLDVIDIQAARGDEIIVDLNHPLPADLANTYDLVLDTGTCEHCFNIGQAAINLANLLKQGGIIIQAMPLNSYNHGFYNVNPTWFHDFYLSNGFEFLFLSGVADVVKNPVFFELPPHDRFREAPAGSVILAVARRNTVLPLKIPTQKKYQDNPHLRS